MQRFAVSRRRFVMGAGSSCALAPLAIMGGCAGDTNLKLARGRFYGASAVAWDSAANQNPDLWRRAVQEMYSCGLRRVTLVTYAFVDPTTGVVREDSVNKLDHPPSLSALRIAAQEAASLGMEVSVRPWVEVDNGGGAGDVWRGFLSLDGGARDQFTSTYGDYIQDLARFTNDIRANRFYVGSELRGLTSKRDYTPFWLDLISSCRRILQDKNCLISYAANFDEYESVLFWDALDEIGIDAYFPLATELESRGPGNPKDEIITRNFDRCMQQLQTFSQRLGKPIFVCEWGVVPFDTTASAPSNELPSTVVDRDEAVRIYRAVVRIMAQQGRWLQGVDFWHWRVDPDEDSNYRIEPSSDIGAVIKSAIETG